MLVCAIYVSLDHVDNFIVCAIYVSLDHVDNFITIFFTITGVIKHMSLNKNIVPETGAALFNSPTSSSNSDANTDEGNWIAGA